MRISSSLCLIVLSLAANPSFAQVSATLHHFAGGDTVLGPFASNEAFGIPVDDSVAEVWVNTTDPTNIDIGRITVASAQPRSQPLSILICGADAFPEQPNHNMANAARDWAGILAT